MLERLADPDSDQRFMVLRDLLLELESNYHPASHDMAREQQWAAAHDGGTACRAIPTGLRRETAMQSPSRRRRSAMAI